MKNSILYISLIASLFFISCSESEKQINENTKEQQQTHDQDHENEIILTQAQFEQGNYQIEKAKPRTFSEVFRVTGKIDVPPKNRALVSSFFSGFVSKTNLLVGDVVKKGDLLIQLQNPDFIELQQTYAEKQSTLDYLASEFNRKQNLLSDQVISEKVFQKAKSDFMSMQAQVEGLQKTLKLMNVDTNAVLSGKFTDAIQIYAPISGKIAKINIAQGMYLQPSTPIMEILNTDHVHLELDVFEKDILKVKVGDTLNFKIPEISDQNFKAYVQLIGAEVTDNRSVRIHAHPVEEDHNFAVGMFIEAFFDYQPNTQMALPATAFVEKENKMHVLQLRKKTADAYHFKMLNVNDVKEQNGFKALKTKEKLAADQLYLTKGAFDLVSGEGGGHDH